MGSAVVAVSTQPVSAQPASVEVRALPADLSGRWRGVYGGGDNPMTPFLVELSGETGSFTGHMAEENTFAAADVPQLFATVEGEVTEDGRVVFLKSYDGTSGVTHSVLYQGHVVEGGSNISGEWSIGETRGEFRMERD